MLVALCMIIGAAIGSALPSVAKALDRATFAQINLIVAALIWVMVFPMMLQIDWDSLKQVKKHPKAIFICTFINWAVQPFVTYGFAELFFRVVFSRYLSEEKEDGFVAGAVLLGGSPCTAMVFVWSKLAGGHPGYSLVQVALNDVIILILYVPTVILLTGASGIHIPYDTVVYSVVMFVVIPFFFSLATRTYMQRRHGRIKAAASIESFVKSSSPFTIVALLLTLIVIFIFQGDRIVDSPADIFFNCIPLILTALFVFALAFTLCVFGKVPYEFAAPACFIATSNFFELAVAVALSAYGLESPAVLTTVVGVLVEVPVMLFFVRIMLWTKSWYEAKIQSKAVIPLSVVR